MTQNTLRQQYQTAANLNARIDLRRRFSANPYPWHRWVFDQLALPADARILELGCGPADLWRENADRIPTGCDIQSSNTLMNHAWTEAELGALYVAAARIAAEGAFHIGKVAGLFVARAM